MILAKFNAELIRSDMKSRSLMNELNAWELEGYGDNTRTLTQKMVEDINKPKNYQKFKDIDGFFKDFCAYVYARIKTIKVITDEMGLLFTYVDLLDDVWNEPETYKIWLKLKPSGSNSFQLEISMCDDTDRVVLKKKTRVTYQNIDPDTIKFQY